MFNTKAQMFNKGARKDSDRVLSSLNIKEGDTIADIGSGGGFFVFEFAQRVRPQGLVYAVDTNEELLAHIKKQQDKKSMKNIKTVRAKEDSPNLPEKSCDLIFLRDVFHHLADPAAYFRLLIPCLKPEGKVAVIDWKPGEHHKGHSVSAEEIERVMTAAGYKKEQSFDFLEKHSFGIFVVKEN